MRYKLNRLVLTLIATGYAVVSLAQDNKQVMSAAYNDIWNQDVQQKIDERIEKHRKADVKLNFADIKKGSAVVVEQIAHDFVFGSNIFLFNQFDTQEKNNRYNELFTQLFNAATVPFYWKTLEPTQGEPRFTKDSKYIYRRPPVDPVVEFCIKNGINMNGHAIIYGMRRWGHPEWMPADRKKMEPIFENHIKLLAERYGDKIQRWDVVNEPIDQANRGIMPDDYTYKCFQWATKYFPSNAVFNLNDCDMNWEVAPVRRYVEIIRNLKDRGAKLDITGIQSHIFNPQGAKAIAAGEKKLTPDKINELLDVLDEAELPIHISEVTISAPDTSVNGGEIQAQIARNLYRLWFSHPTIMGVTWWNAADGGAAEGEPSFSGILDQNLNRKPVFAALQHLIHKEWNTSLNQKIGTANQITFRGFKGKYKVKWLTKKGKSMEQIVEVKSDTNITI
ncbi:glycosyltransferase [Sphingobacterium sp. DK4209]|uniref:endo-1,4-beta-xylanase n=1 Tax=Sphingobacterium zhuxiongii TaxID=2662364 RepID=A0A5Q0QFD2_9SPHI|nr:MULTISPECIES: endo-1,4-beta-xylanase [unclassified Sphingobacterium]MVZ64572.1 glycosyltransferase [Sphingobacterium sp. DK4209]QGA25900.1 glycosyltransferase [Sphingobacterium sp. dk4302]